MKYLQIILYCFLFSLYSIGQGKLERVEGLPTNELYDLHVDKKGYLWIAHSLGISRYDGLNYVHYSHSSQVNLRMTDIVEDAFGRIWCHNYSGQIFYIEKGQIKILEAYDYTKESQYPRMALCGNELLITSQSGLFVCNTANLKTSFFTFKNSSNTATVSLSVLGNKAVVYDNSSWYQYQKGSLEKVKLSSPISLPEVNYMQLQPASYKQEIYLTANPSGVLYKLKLENQSLKLISKEEHHDFINAVTVNAEGWVHTRNKSYQLGGSTTIKDYNLTDIVRGKEGNTWYSSLRDGLMVSFRPSLWEKINFKIDEGDYIRSLNMGGGYFFAGTQKGNLYVFDSDTAKSDWKHELFNGLGSIILSGISETIGLL